MEDLVKYLLLTLAAVSLLSSCDKGGGSFSVLADSSTYEQKAVYTARKIDVLFVVDNSGSMNNFQQQLGANFSSFIDRFITKGYDFRIAVTTSEAWRYPHFMSLPAGCTGYSYCAEYRTVFRKGASSSNYVLDNVLYDLTNPTEQQRLKDDFIGNAHMGVDGSGDERALSSFKAALEYQTMANGSASPNRNFHRPEAFLAVVIISDEEDFSHTGIGLNENYSNPNLIPVDQFKTFLENFTGGTAANDFSVSTISILDSACLATLDPNGSILRKIGHRYMQLADLTGGSKNSLCNPFDETLDNISSQIEEQGSAIFQLAKKPIVSTIKLTVDGVIVPQSDTNGWSYYTDSNVVKVNGSQYRPQNGAAVSLTYYPDLTIP